MVDRLCNCTNAAVQLNKQVYLEGCRSHYKKWSYSSKRTKIFQGGKYGNFSECYILVVAFVFSLYFVLCINCSKLEKFFKSRYCFITTFFIFFCGRTTCTVFRTVFNNLFCHSIATVFTKKAKNSILIYHLQLTSALVQQQ